MNQNIQYLDHLYQSVLKQKENSIVQKGKCNLESSDYFESIQEWYDQIFRLIEQNPPTYFVEALNVFENENQEITEIQYTYYAEDSSILKRKSAVINNFRK